MCLVSWCYNEGLELLFITQEEMLKARWRRDGAGDVTDNENRAVWGLRPPRGQHPPACIWKSDLDFLINPSSASLFLTQQTVFAWREGSKT